MANDRNLERNIASVHSLLKLLKNIQIMPSQYSSDPIICVALHTQLKMGKLNLPDRAIYESSMSTLKRVSDKYLEGGFAELDKHRKLANAALVKSLYSVQTGEDSKEGRRIKARDRKSEILTLRQNMFVRDAVIFKLAHLLVTCAKELDSSTSRDYFMKARAQELYRLGFKGSNIDER